MAAPAKTASRKPAKAPEKIPDWSLSGELILNCNCTVFCPCVVSLGAHPPTEGTCKTWLGVRIDDGQWGKTGLGGLNVAMIIDIPGRMSDGDWKAALYIDERASKKQYEALKAIFTGAAKGTTGLFRMLVSTFLGDEAAPVAFETDGKVRSLTVGRKIVGAVAPVEGADPEQDLTIRNTQYWMGSEITVARAIKGKVRDFGRVWNFEGRSAEICQIAWAGP